ncbi:hypothetical protein RYX36_023540 [Vicia faba]
MSLPIFLFFLIPSLFFKLSHSTTVLVDGSLEWKNPTIYIGDSIIFEHKQHYNLCIFKNQKAFNICNFTEATLLTDPNTTSFTWHPSRVGFFYFTFYNDSVKACQDSQKLAIKVTSATSAAPEASSPTATTPAPSSGGDVQSSPSFPWQCRLFKASRSHLKSTTPPSALNPLKHQPPPLRPPQFKTPPRKNYGFPNKSTLQLQSQTPPKSNSPFTQALATSNNKTDPCGGRYIYVHDLPSRFNQDMLRDCKTLSLWTNMCKFTTNAGLGPPLENIDGVFSDKGWYATNRFAIDVIFANRMKQYECLTKDSSIAAAVFVPFYAGFDIARYLWGYNISMRDAASLDLVDWLTKRPQWGIMNGRDHFLVAGRITWDFRRLSEENRIGGTSFCFYQLLRICLCLLLNLVHGMRMILGFLILLISILQKMRMCFFGRRG